MENGEKSEKIGKGTGRKMLRALSEKEGGRQGAAEGGKGARGEKPLPPSVLSLIRY